MDDSCREKNKNYFIFFLTTKPPTHPEIFFKIKTGLTLIIAAVFIRNAPPILMKKEREKHPRGLIIISQEKKVFEKRHRTINPRNP